MDLLRGLETYLLGLKNFILAVRIKKIEKIKIEKKIKTEK